MPRPANLPEYQSPPLAEVIMDIQFQPIKGYSSLHAGDIYKLFQKRFPVHQECAPVPSVFEIFGVNVVAEKNELPFQFKGELSNFPPERRHWFLSENRNKLIQFQPDRIIMNWRKEEDSQDEYPRFDKLFEEFKGIISTLEKYFSDTFDEKPLVTQCELTYVNNIKLIDKKPNLSDWILGFEHIKSNYEGVKCEYSRVLTKSDEKSKENVPYARIYTRIDYFAKLPIHLGFTVRGKAGDTFSDSYAFFDTGRTEIVKKFDDITTKSAHTFWEKNK